MLPLASGVLGQPDEKLVAAVDALTATALAEQQLVISCLATVPSSAKLAGEVWKQDVAEAVILLDQLGFPAAYVAHFKQSAAPENFVQRDASFGQVIDMCNSDPDWERRMYQMEFTILAIALRRLRDGEDS